MGDEPLKGRDMEVERESGAARVDLAAGLACAWSDAYAEALGIQIAAPSQAGLMRALEIGREAERSGSSVTELTLAHHAVLEQALAGPHPQGAVTRAAGFLAQALAPFEQAQAVERQERRRAEEALWQAQRHQAVGRLASGVAHHFNNLLTAILGNLELVRRDHGDNRPLSQKLDRASEAARRAVKLTRQLLTFSGRQAPRPDLFEPGQGLPDLIALLCGSVRGEVAVTADIPAGLWPVRVDSGELELALLNLAINAGDAMAGCGDLRISVANRSFRDDRLELDGDYLVIDVADNGPGIPPDILPRVFDPFFTTKAVGVGSGLGLSQVLGFAHQSKGAVDVAETPGGGATFRIFLPAARGEAACEPLPERSPAGTVLVVEDDADIAEIAASILESHGFGARFAYRGAAALDVLRRGEAIQLILCGSSVGGGLGGVRLAEDLRAAYPAVPVLVTAGASDAAAAARAAGLPVIMKPYRSGDLYRCIAPLLSA